MEVPCGRCIRAHQQLASVDRREALYAVAWRALAVGAGVRSSSEESTALGRSDVTLAGNGSGNVFEFKMKGRGDPLEQAARKGCADRYRNSVGVTMDPGTRNVERFELVRPCLDRAPGRPDETAPCAEAEEARQLPEAYSKHVRGSGISD